MTLPADCRIEWRRQVPPTVPAVQEPCKMKPHTLTLSLVIALSLVTLAACDKHGKQADAAAAPAATNTMAATNDVVAANTPAVSATNAASSPAPAADGDTKEKAKAMKLACAEEIKKFCTGGEKPGRCLKEHASELSPGCTAAREALKAARKAEKDE